MNDLNVKWSIAVVTHAAPTSTCAAGDPERMPVSVYCDDPAHESHTSDDRCHGVRGGGVVCGGFIIILNEASS